MAHAWKVCVRQRTEGSNPSLSAKHASYKVQRSPAGRKFSNLAAFLLSYDVQYNLLTYRHQWRYF